MIDELARAEFAIELAGSVTLPEEMVSPFDPVNNPAEVIVPVPVVEIFPVVEIVMFEARSEPVIEAKVGRPAAFPCKTVVVVPAKVPRSPAAVFVTTPAVDNPTSVIEVLPVRVVNVPAPGVPPPIAPGLANVAPPKVEALIVPVPVKFKEAPDPTTIAAVVFVPDAIVEKAGEPPELSVAQSHVPVPAAHFKIWVSEQPRSIAKFPAESSNPELEDVFADVPLVVRVTVPAGPVAPVAPVAPVDPAEPLFPAAP